MIRNSGQELKSRNETWYTIGNTFDAMEQIVDWIRIDDRNVLSNAQTSIHVNCKLDSNEIDDSKKHREKHDELRIPI
jgi:hypothetical protein